MTEECAFTANSPNDNQHVSRTYNQAIVARNGPVSDMNTIGSNPNLSNNADVQVFNEHLWHSPERAVSYNHPQFHPPWIFVTSLSFEASKFDVLAFTSMTGRSPEARCEGLCSEMACAVSTQPRKDCIGQSRTVSTTASWSATLYLPTQSFTTSLCDELTSSNVQPNTMVVRFSFLTCKLNSVSVFVG